MTAAKALDGLLVLDLSRILAGPWASQLLADLGARVIKVERPGVGDDTRGWGPPFDAETGDAVYYHAANRNKESIALDIADPRGQAIVKRIAEQADVLIENFKVGGLAKYGLDYASLSALNPRLVYCSITGFGQTGPYAARPGYDALLQAMGGLMSITGERDDLPGGGPQKVGVAICDLLTGLYAANGIQAALLHRERSGRGQHIDLALLETQIACLANQNMNYLMGGEVPRRLGTAHPNIVPYQTFRTADGFVVVAVGNDEQFARFADLCERPAWRDNERWRRNRGRVEDRDALLAEIEPVLAARPTAHWVAAMAAHNVPGGPVNTIADLFDDPHVKARGLKHDIPADDGTARPTVVNPLRLSETPAVYERQPPRLGADTDSVLQDFGIDDAERAALRDAGIIG